VDSVSTRPQKLKKKKQDGVGVVTVFTLISLYLSPVTHKIFHTVLSGVLVFTISGRDVHVYLTMPSVAQTVPASNGRIVNLYTYKNVTPFMGRLFKIANLGK
jgi:hypothetical protein